MFQPVSLAELEVPIVAWDAYEWVQNLLERYHYDDESRRILQLGKGTVSKILEEVLPLAVYAKERIDFENVYLHYFASSSQSFDAEFRTGKGELVERTEVTIAINGFEEQIRRETIEQHGWSPGFGLNEYIGSVRNREIPEPEHRLHGQEEAVENLKNLVASAYSKKLENIDKYPGTSLLIGVDCFVLNSTSEFQKVISPVVGLKTPFEAVNIVDTNGRFYHCHK
ncbi:hypothetical protein NLU14_07890 [Marinobacter sp. 71-i]|uniref:Uncharacterized protein n=1 Tax=Marinobacter iranensis TaxID=2962607 RepID=A0ABT5Y906_9GAMM|nr:hypothetical protein [Marinobacter iranensis]MDF0750152.1 hypothetical protein [Marinobacter iranensis]